MTGDPFGEHEETARWAREHQLPYYEEQVHFPDARVEYENRDSRSRHEELEVVTGYRGAHARGGTVRTQSLLLSRLHSRLEERPTQHRTAASRAPRMNLLARGAGALAERSVIQWPEKLAVPLLMIHGADDEEVPVSQALAFAARLSSLRKEYELIVYAKEIHEALNNRRDRDARIVARFRRYLR